MWDLHKYYCKADLQSAKGVGCSFFNNTVANKIYEANKFVLICLKVHEQYCPANLKRKQPGAELGQAQPRLGL